MLFPERKTSLVRLSDCIKLGIGGCLETTNSIIDLHLRYKYPLQRLKNTAQKVLYEKISHEEGEKECAELIKDIPQDVAVLGVNLSGKLHSECLSVLLNCCFALESYVNTLEYYLVHEKDFLGLSRSGHEATAEVLSDAIEKMSTLTKWETLGKLKKGKSFDRSKSPYQDLKILFNFRNDIVHDKVSDYSDDRSNKRYNKKLPDPVFGFLDLRHVTFAADTYWGMITEIHSILGTEMKDFHGHYNLKPWFSSDFEEEVRRASIKYQKVIVSEK